MKKKVVIFMSILSIFAGLTGCGKSKEPVESNKESEVVSESVLDYVDGEEHDAKKMFGGTPLESYCVYLDNGDIEITE